MKIDKFDDTFELEEVTFRSKDEWKKMTDKEKKAWTAEKEAERMREEAHLDTWRRYDN